ncbi:hypothetical protein B0H16DRAFT_291302 [Mycena metata]|uniref:DRBM domain-containing protein n=1 Tax=Mycena metata TaxID=1033252 RepID=A0AAD7P1L3_9AGAR|nr:hypothetical protein B0H16DRAFT_291302 [Mycena metata]
MPFISNADNFTLEGGTYINVQESYNVHTHNLTNRRDEIEELDSSDEETDELLLRDRPDKRPRLEEEDAASGLRVIREQNLQLIRQIGSGPGYLLHAARNKARAVTVKVFNSNDPNVRQQLESAVTLCKKLMHPNVLRMKGISSATSLSQFIVYEDVSRKNAKGPLATALQNRTRSVQLGFKMVADLSAGLDYLSRQGISLAVIRAENFDVFLDADDRFLIIINTNSSDEGDAPHSHGSQEDNAWALFNSLCDKVLLSANRVLHAEEIDKDPMLLLPTSPASQKSDSSSFFIGSSSEQEDAVVSSVGDPRREYVWRTMDRGKQSLSTVTDQITTHLDIALARLQILRQTDERRAHRCRGYTREEITLAPTIVDSAVVDHDTPRPLEICSICREIVGLDDRFRCICGDCGPGYTIKCGICKFWSHSDCVGNVQSSFTCRLCEGFPVMEPRTDFPLQDTYTPRGFVANLPYSVRWQDLKDLFHRASNVLRAEVSLGQAPGPRSGRSFVPKLNNYYQSRNSIHLVSWIEYSTGPPHQIRWTVQCKVSGEVIGTGVAESKSAAKDEAGRLATVALGI